VPRSPFLHVVPPATALGLGALRWWLQGSGNTYTATSKRFFVPDPDLGWVPAASQPVWLGLEVLGILAGVVLGFVAVAFFVRWRERARGVPMKKLRVLGWILAVLPVVIPAWAFASGGRPAGGVDALPSGTTAIPDRGITGSLDAPAGSWVTDSHSTITAHLSAGGESFDARLPVNGRVTLDPRDLRGAIIGAFSAPSAQVDTGISLRSKHAREDYLDAEHHPSIGFDLIRVEATRQDAPDLIAFRADGVVHLLGRDHQVVVGGTLRRGDAAAASRLGVRAAPLLAQADFTLHIKDTALAPDAGDFDRDEIPIHVSLVLIPEEKP
jgi:hypothetical protein